MSLNGRRFWRSWAKSYRRWLNRDDRRRYRDLYDDEPLVKHQYTWFEAKKQFGPGLLCSKAKPLAPRSLVGMTQGARKRAALVDYVSDRPLSQCLPSQRREYTALAKAAMQGMGVPSGQPRRDPYYKKTCLAKYRIGQKLRPCAGCIRCECQTAFDVWPKLGEALAKDHPTCDGSGVLTARRA